MKFAHLADCHLGGWRQLELQELNFQSFQKAVSICIEEKVDFILIAGDLFDSAYPPIEILKESFAEFRKIQDAGIPVYIIAGSHDFSASGKTFLDVLEKAGFCRKIEQSQVLNDGTIVIHPYMHKEIAIFGYAGKKSGMEIQDYSKLKFDSIHPFTIFMTHTTISDVVGKIPMESIDKLKLPLANYYALGHIHQRFEIKESNSIYIYPGPTFPNNFQELADLKYGSFQLVEVEFGKIKTKNIPIQIKEILFFNINISNALTAIENIINQLDKSNLKDKIVLLKLTGTLNQGKTGDIRFSEIEDFIFNKKLAFSFIRNISSLKVEESDFHIEAGDMENVEEKIIQEYVQKNPEDFNKFLPPLMNALSMEKNEDEKSQTFESRLMDELNKIFNIRDVI